MIIKVCGMRTAENIREVEKLSPDLIGFIFYPPSPRFVARQPDYLPAARLRTGVFVNETGQRIIRIAEQFGLTHIQLHGEESPALCSALKDRDYTVIKAFSILSAKDFERIGAYGDCCDYALFDTPSAQRGGTGRKFDWECLSAYDGPLPFLLSGGIGPDDLDALAAFRHPLLAGYDLNSRFETAPGHKDVALLAQFIHQLKK